MIKYLVVASALFLSACSMSSSPAVSLSTAVTSVYISQFPDVPIPMQMKTIPSKTLTTLSSSGEKVGREMFSGRIDHTTLGAAMAHSLKNQGWSMIGIVQSTSTLQLYKKSTRFLILNIEAGTISSSMDLWMISHLDQHMGLSAVPPQALLNPQEANKK